MTVPLRIDPQQRFTCQSCGRCCRRWEILVSQAEVSSLRQADATRWFRDRTDAPEGEGGDPFEPVSGWRGLHRIRKRDDGACGFLSNDNRCRLHEELGGSRKPLTCRVFPYRFNPAPNAVVVTTSFGCPTVVANSGERIATGARLEEVRALRVEWFGNHRYTTQPRDYVRGRSIGPASLQILREGLLQMLDRTDRAGKRDLRANVRRMAAVLEDLTRRRVVRLPGKGFAEYLALTVPHAASRGDAPPALRPSRVGRLLQHGFLYVVAATRLRIESGHRSRWWQRLAMLRLLAHFHGLAPGFARVSIGVLNGHANVNDPDIQPLAHHYLRSRIEAIGASGRPVLDDFAISVSYLNAGGALAEMNAHAAGLAVDRRVFSEALMEAVDLSHVDEGGWLGRVLERFAGGVEALHAFGRA